MRLPLLLAALLCATGCDWLVTDAPVDADIFDAPVAGLTQSELAAFARGDAEFGRRFAPSTGLGPIFNNVSCASCHSGDGRGRLSASCCTRPSALALNSYIVRRLYFC